MLKHLSFAKHRFDSMADPVAKTALMLLPICTLLSTVSCDARVSKEKRERAAESLQLFTPKFCLSLGALADYGLLCAAFIRKYDALDHDIAASERELLDFQKKMRRVFVEGWFLASHAQTVAGQRLLRGQFITELVRRQTKKKCVFNAGPKQLLVWGTCSDADVQEISNRCSYMTEVMLERLRAEADSDHLRRSFQAFDIPRILEARLDRPLDRAIGGNNVRRVCIRGLRRLAEAVNVNADICELEYVDVAPIICAEAGRLTAPANRLLWSNVLDGAWLQKHFASRIETIAALPILIRFYLAVLDGECQVERDLGAVLAESTEHTNLQIDGIDDLMMIRGTGLQGAADFGNLEAGTLTPFTKTCLKLWRSVYGCRYGSYDNKHRVQIRHEKQRATFAHLKQDVFVAAHSRTILPSQVVSFSKYVDGAAPPGAPCQDLVASDFCTLRHNRFLQASKEKMRAAKIAMGKRGRGQVPYPVATTKYAAPSMPSLDRLAKVAMLTADQPGAASGRRMSAQTGFDRCYTADIVVTDTIAPLLGHEHSGPQPFSMTDIVYIVGLGRMVISTTSWQRAQGDPRRLTESDVTRHVPMAQQLAVEIAFSTAMRHARPEVYKAMKKCCGAQGSKWRMRQAVTAPENGEWFGDEQDILKLFRRVRGVINSRGPKIALQSSGLGSIEGIMDSV